LVYKCIINKGLHGKNNETSILLSKGTTPHCGLWPVEQCPSIFSYLPPTLSTFLLPALKDLFLIPLSIFSWVFPFLSFLPVLEWRSFWASYPPPFSLGDITSLQYFNHLDSINFALQTSALLVVVCNVGAVCFLWGMSRVIDIINMSFKFHIL